MTERIHRFTAYDHEKSLCDQVHAMRLEKIHLRAALGEIRNYLSAVEGDWSYIINVWGKYEHKKSRTVV